MSDHKRKMSESVAAATMLEIRWDDMTDAERKESVDMVLYAYRELMALRNFIQGPIRFDVDTATAIAERAEQ